MQPGNGPPATGERWNVNLPAVVGVVVVFLVGVVVWVVTSSADEDAGRVATVAATGAPAAPLRTTSTAAPSPTLTPTPLPTSTSPTSTTPPTTASPTSAPTSSAVTTSAVTTSPATTTPDAGSDAVRGDLDIPGQAMSRPPCDGGFITIVGSPVGSQATAEAVGAVLDAYPGTNYLRTDQSCSSLTQDVDGEPIYVIYFGPFVVASDACSARADGPADAYARALSDDLGPDHSVDCA